MKSTLDLYNVVIVEIVLQQCEPSHRTSKLVQRVRERCAKRNTPEMTSSVPTSHLPYCSENRHRQKATHRTWMNPAETMCKLTMFAKFDANQTNFAIVYNNERKRKNTQKKQIVCYAQKRHQHKNHMKDNMNWTRPTWWPQTHANRRNNLHATEKIMCIYIYMRKMYMYI